MKKLEQLLWERMTDEEKARAKAMMERLKKSINGKGQEELLQQLMPERR